MSRILFCATVDSHIKSFHLSYIDELNCDGNTVDVITNGLIKRNSVHKSFNVSFSRNPLSINNYHAYKELKKILKNNKYDLISCHTPIASALIRFAARKYKSIKIVYTAHGFHFYKGAPFIQKKVFIMIEKQMAKFTDVLITINSEDYQASKIFTLKKNGKCFLFKGIGAHLNKKCNRTRNEILDAVNVPENSFVLVTVGELNKNKNQKLLIEAMKEINIENSYLLICGTGKDEDYLKTLSKKLGVEKRVKFLGYRNDVHEILSASDIFMFMSHREGLSLAVIEAMNSSLPVVASKIRGNVDLIDENKGGFLLDLSEEKLLINLSNKIKTLVINKSLRENMGFYNKKKSYSYSYENVKQNYLNIYESRISDG